MHPYHQALKLNGGDLNQEQVDLLMAEETRVRILNENRAASGLSPIGVDVAGLLSHTLQSRTRPGPERVVAEPTTHWVPCDTHQRFDTLEEIWRVRRQMLSAHVGTQWLETVVGKSVRRTFTEADATLLFFAVCYQAATYEQFGRKLGIRPYAAGRRIKILERGGYLTIRVANPFKFRIASPTVKTMRLVDLRGRHYTGAESQLVHRLMVTEIGLEHELRGHGVLSEYAIGVDPEHRLLFKSPTYWQTATHRTDLVVRILDPNTGTVTVRSIEYERTRKRKKELANAIWYTAQSGRVDELLYISPRREILKLVEHYAAINKLSAEVTTVYRPLPAWLCDRE